MADRRKSGSVDELLEIAKHRVTANRAKLGSDPALRKETVPTDIPDLDAILGGGWRRGRMALIVGNESMGKTLVAQWTIKAFQARDYTCGLIDPEKTFDAEWFAATGVDPSKLIVVVPTTAEEAFDLAVAWVQAGIDLVVIDGLASLIPKARLEADLDEQQLMGKQAAVVTEGIQRLTAVNDDSLILCTNQLRSKVGKVYGSPDNIPAGRAQKFYSSWILKVRRGNWIKDGDRKLGYELKAETEKSKLTPPYQECIVPFMYTGVIDVLGGLLELAMDLNLIEGKGYYTWREQKFHGKTKLKEHFQAHPEEEEELRRAVETIDLPNFDEEVAI